MVAVRSDESWAPKETDTRIENSDAEKVRIAIQTGDRSVLDTKRAWDMYTEEVIRALKEEQDQKAKASAGAAAAQRGGGPTAYPLGSGTTTGTVSPNSTGPSTPPSAAWIAEESGVQIRQGAPDQEPTVLRRLPGQDQTRLNWGSGGAPTYEKYRTAESKTTVPFSEYQGEYARKSMDPAFREWIQKMGVVVGNTSPTDPNFLTSLENVWSQAGAMVASNPYLAGRMTPEEWLEQQYKLQGGDAAYEKAMADAVPEEVNPITTQTSTQTYQVTAAQAQSAVDQISQVLLGRMASDAELKKARSAMQKLLTPTVTKTVTDATDPNDVQQTVSTKAGVGPGEAIDMLRMRTQRSSEGMAFGAGKMFLEALRGIG